MTDSKQHSQQKGHSCDRPGEAFAPFAVRNDRRAKAGLRASFTYPLQFARKVARTLPTFVGKFRKALSYRVIQCGRRQRLGGGDRFRFPLEDRARHTQMALALKSAFAGK